MRYLKQAVQFIATSGVGFLIDFALYGMLTELLLFPVSSANMVSAIPAVTFVFLVSTKKTFQTKKNKLSIVVKYFIYFLYQIVLVSCVSWIGQWIYDLLIHQVQAFPLLSQHLKIVVKCFITPITMVSNFFVLKAVSEKL